MPNEYDEIKGFLNKIRRIQTTVNNYGLIKEQNEIENDQNVLTNQDTDYDDNSQPEKEDIAVVNDVEIKIHSEDPEDLELQDIEKQKISQLIDDFRKEVSEITEFGTLHVYPNNAKLDGRISDFDLSFMLSTGDDRGLYISNPSMIKIDDDTINMVNKLRTFEPKFVNSINDLLVSRRST